LTRQSYSILSYLYSCSVNIVTTHILLHSCHSVQFIVPVIAVTSMLGVAASAVIVVHGCRGLDGQGTSLGGG